MPVTPFFRQGALTVGRIGDDVVITVGAGCEAVIAGDGVVWTTREDPEAVAVAEVVVETIVRRRHGHFHVHAGVVALAGGAILVAGRSGAGKTTTTLALARTPGAALLGDDAAFAWLDGETVVASALARPLHLGEATQRMFPDLTIRPGVRTALGKVVVDAPPPCPSLRVTGLVLPHIEDVATTSSTPLAPAQVLGRLMEASASVAWPLAGTDAHLDVLRRLAALPALSLCLGRDALVDADVIRRAVGPARLAGADGPR